jgi:hypothetical protein
VMILSAIRHPCLYSDYSKLTTAHFYFWNWNYLKTALQSSAWPGLCNVTWRLGLGFLNNGVTAVKHRHM